MQPANPTVWPSGSTPIGEHIRLVDWANTPLGALPHWPQSLKTTLDLALRSPLPMALLWGIDGVLLANNAYIAFVGEPHVRLGSTIQDSWAHSSLLDPTLFHEAFAGDAQIVPEQAVTLQRHGAPRQAWLHMTYTPVADERGDLAGVVVILVEVTERKQVEKALQQSEDRYRSFMTHSSEGIWRVEIDPPMITTLSPEEQIDYCYQHVYLAECNDVMARMYGFTAAHEIIGARLGDLLPASDPANRAYLGAFIRAGYRLVDAESHELDRYGEDRYFLNNLIGVAENGRLVRAWGTQRDITERKRMEAALRASEARLHVLYEQEQAARAQAEEASRIKDDFLATVSHELRTPLTAILGYAQMLQARKRDETYIARAVDKMVRSAKTQAQLIEDLLDISRIVSGKMHIVRQPTDLLSVIRAALDTVRPTVEAKNLNLHVTIDTAATTLNGDADRLQQVIWNLLSNATKFTPPGGTIYVELEPRDGMLQLSVRDTGQGINAGFLPYVFDRFRQAESTSTRSFGGLGLGLAIVRHLVELHGGTVQVASPGEGHGATFTVRLPREGTSNEFVPAAKMADGDNSITHYSPALRNLRVVIVDDQPEILVSLHNILAPCGAIVQTCLTAQEALEAIRTGQPDVLISDIGMPSRDGYWLIQEVRELPPDMGGAIPALALTAYTRVEERIQVLAHGYQLYISKPVDPAELRDLVHVGVNISRVMPQAACLGTSI